MFDSALEKYWLIWTFVWANSFVIGGLGIGLYLFLGLGFHLVTLFSSMAKSNLLDDVYLQESVCAAVALRDSEDPEVEGDCAGRIRSLNGEDALHRRSSSARPAWTVNATLAVVVSSIACWGNLKLKVVINSEEKKLTNTTLPTR